MKTFKVSQPEVYYQVYEVKAENAEQAIDMVLAGEGLMLENNMEYSHILDKSVYLVDEL